MTKKETNIVKNKTVLDMKNNSRKYALYTIVEDIEGEYNSENKNGLLNAISSGAEKIFTDRDNLLSDDDEKRINKFLDNIKQQKTRDFSEVVVDIIDGLGDLIEKVSSSSLKKIFLVIKKFLTGLNKSKGKVGTDLTKKEFKKSIDLLVNKKSTPCISY
jgi:hypothetical protein